MLIGVAAGVQWGFLQVLVAALFVAAVVVLAVEATVLHVPRRRLKRNRWR